ncbi:hypothetical protein FK513_28150, partial [Klebsiella pneumoniae]|nr:hypothetical protein [Klebsiella pneumoniae]
MTLKRAGLTTIASHGRTRPDGSHYLRSSAQLTGVDFDNSDIRFIGTADIDLEAVAAARPDLIITEPSRHVSVEQLEKIATAAVSRRERAQRP